MNVNVRGMGRIGALGLFLLFLVSSVDASQTSAQEPWVGVAALLELGVGARPLGMGGAFVGLADDEAAAFYNPAGLAFLEDRRFSGFATRPFFAFDYLALGLVGPSAGFHLLQLNAPQVEATNEFGNPNGRRLTYLSRAGVGAAGVHLGAGLALGVRVRTYQEISGEVEGFGWAVDPAALYVRGPWRLGALLVGAFSEEIRFDNGHREPWPQDLIVGGSGSWEALPQVTIRVVADVGGLLQRAGRRPHLHLGAEVWFQDLGLRVGLDDRLLTAGMSVSQKDLRLDWAYALHPRLPDTYRLSLTVIF